MTVLVCYDGSNDAQRAVRTAGELCPGQHAIVLTVWEGLTEVLARSRVGLAVAALDFEQIEAAAERGAQECAQAGAGLARACGLAGTNLVARCDPSTAETILRVAEEHNVELTVLGSRGLTGVTSLLGSVSRGVLGHADRPVLLVPCHGGAPAPGGRRGPSGPLTTLDSLRAQFAPAPEDGVS